MSQRDQRVMFLVTGAIVFVDTMFYAVVAPLLPVLTHQLHLSKASAGVLTASYAVGMLVGAIPAGALAERYGPRVATYTGLALLGASSLAFGVLDNVLMLDAARFAQGVGGACTWSGILAWLIAEVPVDRRGSAIGWALAAGIGGALFGPVIGTLAHGLGRGAVFSAVVVVAVVLAAAVQVLPPPSPAAPEVPRAPLLRQLLRPGIALGMWLTALPAIASGTINVLAPLRLGQLGAGAAGIGATFLLGAAVEAGMSQPVGHLSDRRGRIFPLRIGLAGAALTLALFTLPHSALALAAVVVLQTVALGIFWVPSMAMLSDTADTYGMGQGYAMALINLAWAAGQIAGAGGGGALAQAAGDAVPFALAAGLCAATLGLLLPRPRSAPAR
jgi:MFS family permease